MSKAILSFAAAGRILDSGRRDPFLRELREAEENQLHITICGAVTALEAAHPTGNGAVDAVLAHCTPLLPDTAETMEIVFEDYVLYQVRNESFCSYDPQEIGAGKYLAVFEKSKLLDYLTVTVDAGLLSLCDAPWKHYRISTQNQIIDVIAQEEPKVYR